MRVPRFWIYAGFAVVLACIAVNVWRGLNGQGWNW
jgi:hypothetical protein